MKKVIIFFALLFSIDAFSSDLIFKLNGKVVKKYSLSELKSKKFKSTEVTLFNAWRGYERTYKGIQFFRLLDQVYGKSWRWAISISFLAIDGYKQIASIKKMLKASKKRVGYITLGEKGLSGFSKFKRKGKTIDPGPIYLVWSNFSNEDKVDHGDTLKWPYQLRTIDIKND